MATKQNAPFDICVQQRFKSDCACVQTDQRLRCPHKETLPVSILNNSIAGRYRPVRVADGPITARCRFIKNANWVVLLAIQNLPRKVSEQTARMRRLIWIFAGRTCCLTFGRIYKCNLFSRAIRERCLRSKMYV